MTYVPSVPARRTVQPVLAILWLLASGGSLRAATSTGAPALAPPSDPIAVEVARWQQRIRSSAAVDEETKQIREGSLPLLDQAQKALGEGKRWFAWSRLAFVWTNLEAADYRAGIPGDLQKQMTALEQQWTAAAPELTGARQDFAGAPAAARAVGESALSELEGYYEASLDYGRNTAPEYGLFYLGAAKAQLSLARLAASLRPARSEGATRPLALRDLKRDIATVEDALLAAYQPPASIDGHSVFIRVSALLKQAEEMNAAGLRHGALYKLLDAKMRLARLLHPERVLGIEETERRAREAESGWTSRAVDSSLARMFVEIARMQVSDPDPAALGGPTAAAVFDDVLPLYQSLLGPAPPAPPEQVAEVTVTLLRWPYT